MSRRVLAGLIAPAILVVLVLVGRDGPRPSDAGDRPPAAAGEAAGAEAVAMPGDLAGLLITFGLKDQSPTDWDGEVTLSAGKLLALEIVQGNPKAAVEGDRFRVRSTLAKMAAKKKETVTRPTVRLTLDAPATARVKVATKQGTFEFSLADLAEPGATKALLDGRVSVAREEGAVRLTTGADEHDYPALARGADGVLWLAYAEYRKGKPYLAERVLLGDFDALVPRGHGDRVRLRRYDGKRWGAPIDVTGGGLDVWRPTVTVTGNQVHIAWGQQVDGHWDVYHRVYTLAADGVEGKWSDAVRVNKEPGTGFHVVSATSSAGDVWLAWQGWRQGHFQIFARKLPAGPEIAVTTAPANHWAPAIAADSAGRVYVAYDHYEKGNYDVRLAEVTGTTVRTVDVAATARFEARPSIACDRHNRVWVAYEEGDEQWGKDYSNEKQYTKVGLTGNPGNGLYVQRTLRVRCLADGAVMQPAGDLEAALRQRSVNNRTMPRLALDGAGGLWLLYRHHPRPLGNGEVWNSFAVRWDGKEWSVPRRLGRSDNLMDNRPALAPAGPGLMVVFSGDARLNQQKREHNHLYATVLTAAGMTRPAELVADPPAPPAQLKAVHPAEAEDIARMRAYRVEHEGKKLRLVRGEFHRHTEYTAHRDGDGLLEDSWRYALDAGGLDWMGNGDHDNGHHDEYSWWQIQKTADVMHHPPTFVAVQSYERSVKYPNGHRNVIFPKRGIRPLPRGGLPGTEEKGSADTHVLYQYLRHFGGMCSSHTSATDMGTDWRDNDPVVEPVVEIYQGHRHNYELPGAPRSPTAKTQIGGFEPKGFVVNALDKGYRLGFQSSSDHISTHISYGIVMTDDLSRQGIIDAFKRRHSYAATDNIVLEFRCGKHVMGDAFETTAAPKFDVKVIGTAPVARVSFIRDGKYLHVAEPAQREAAVTFTDENPPAGRTSYYYVRIEQSDGNLAWASPMWITYRGK